MIEDIGIKEFLKEFLKLLAGGFAIVVVIYAIIALVFLTL